MTFRTDTKDQPGSSPPVMKSGCAPHTSPYPPDFELAPDQEA